MVGTQVATPTNFSGRVGPSTLAFRAVSKPNGDVVVVHQSSSDTVLGTGLGAYYGGNCGGSVADTFISEFPAGSITQNYGRSTTVGLGGATGPLDVAISPDGKRTAIVATGNSWALAAAGMRKFGRRCGAYDAAADAASRRVGHRHRGWGLLGSAGQDAAASPVKRSQSPSMATASTSSSTASRPS